MGTEGWPSPRLAIQIAFSSTMAEGRMGKKNRVSRLWKNESYYLSQQNLNKRTNSNNQNPFTSPRTTEKNEKGKRETGSALQVNNKLSNKYVFVTVIKTCYIHSSSVKTSHRGKRQKEQKVDTNTSPSGREFVVTSRQKAKLKTRE